jgi:hypothetical protein
LTGDAASTAGGHLGDRERGEGDQEKAGREQAAVFLRQLREKADRAAVLGAGGAARRGRRRGVTQAEVASALRAWGHKVSLGWFQKLESGTARWTEPLVAAYSYLMQLPAAESTILYKLTLGYEPQVLAALDEASAANQAHIDDVPYAPAYIEDDAWQVRQRNDTMASWFPALRPGANVMVWALTDPVARIQLVDWATRWGAPMLAQLRTAWYLAEGELKSRLEAVIDTCLLGSPDVERLWREDNARYHLGAMGDVRRLDLPATGLITVRLWAAEPIGKKGWRAISMHRIG